jgi:hypothetical protein
MSTRWFALSGVVFVVVALALYIPWGFGGEYRTLTQAETQSLSGGIIYVCNTTTVACTQCAPDTICIPNPLGSCTSSGGQSGCSNANHPPCDDYGLSGCAACSCGTVEEKQTTGCFLPPECNPMGWTSKCAAMQSNCSCDC